MGIQISSTLAKKITFAGTANEVEVSTTADANGDVAGATITLGLPDNVTIELILP